MRVRAAFGVFAILAASAHAADAPGYDDLLARLKAGDTAIDYTALRYAYADSPGYDGYNRGPGDARGNMIKTFNGGDCAKALSHAFSILNAIYIDAEAHFVASRCYEKTGETSKAGFHHAIATGLEKSVFASGDGKSSANAFIVVRIAEEYYTLGLMGLQVNQQSLMQADGHSFDLMETTDTRGNSVTIYFQIDRLLAGLSKDLDAN